MIIPKARQLPSGNWFIQLRLKGGKASGTFASESEAIAWATSYKETYKKGYRPSPNYEKLLRGIAKEDAEEAKKSVEKLPVLATELEMVDKMDGLSFEKYCTRLFILSGYFNGSRYI